ncbi:MAG: hypothetical protein IJW24_00520, partial [Clostridia bacterium]|nr:hypothetical protein [Clostridia bacterium]
TIINSGTITSHASNGGAIFNADPFPITDTTYDTGLTINGGSISNTKGVAIYTLMPMSIDGEVSCVGALALGTYTPLADDYDGENVYYRTGYLNIAGESHSQIYEIDIFDYEMDSTNLNYSICDDQEMIKIHYLKDYSSDIDGINYTALNLSIVRGENIDRDKLSFYSNSDEMIGFYSANDGYGLCESLLFTLDGVEYYVAYGTEVLFEDGRVTFDGQTIEIDGYDPEFMSLEYRIDNGDLYYFDGVELYNSYIDGFGEYFVSETLYVFEDVVVCVETQTIEYSINVASSYEFLAYGGCEFEVNGIDIMVDGVSVNFNDCFGQGAGNCYAVLQHWNVEGELQDADGNVLELEGEQVEDGVYYVCSDLYITYEAIEKEKIETSYSCYKSGITNFEESGVIEGFEFEVYVEGDDYNAWVTIRYAYDSNGYEFIYDELTINIDFDSTYDELTGNYLAEGYEGEYVTYDDGQEAMEWQGGYYIGSWVESIEISVLVYLRD